MKLTMILPLLLAAAAAAAQQPSIPGPLEHFPVPFDVLHYDAELDLTRAPARDMRGVVEVTVRWRPESSERFFGFHLRSLVIDSVLYNGEAVSVASVGDSTSPRFHYIAGLPTSGPGGDTGIYRIAYHGRMSDELGPGSWGGVGSSDNTLFAMGVGLSNSYVSTTQHWMPVFDHPSDKATFRGRFRTRGAFVTASNGLLTTSVSGDTSIYEWRTAIPTATYLLTFATAPYVPMSFGSDPVPMVVYSQPRDTQATRTAFSLLPRMVEAFTSRFIPYPFEKVGYAHTPVGAMEHQTMISYPVSLVNRTDVTNYIAAHELAHQWFGDLVTPPDYRHVWLTESFATYCESVWEEELGGLPRYLRSQESKLAAYINNIAPREGIFPLFDFPRAAPSSNYPETIYQKGAVVVGMLRWEMGDSAFLRAMRDYLTTYAYGVASTEQLLEVLEEHHGAPLGWFFDQWVYGKGWPELAITGRSEPQGPSHSRVTLEVRQSAVGDQRVYRRLAIPIAFEGATDTTSRVAVLDDAVQTIVLDSVPSYRTMRFNRGLTTRSLFRVTSVSGIEVAAPDSGAIEFFVKPNPTDGSAALTVQVRGTEECVAIRYELYDASGRRIGTGTSDGCEFTIPTDGIASGAYVLRFTLREQFYDVPIAVAR